MTQKDITKQSEKYKRSLPYDTHTASRMASAFEAGAEWRIKSIWHKAKQKPVAKNNEVSCRIIYQQKRTLKCYVNLYCFEHGDLLYNGAEWGDVKRWAYVSDLLPIEKE